jgi:hypothetical protein
LCFSFYSKLIISNEVLTMKSKWIASLLLVLGITSQAADVLLGDLGMDSDVSKEETSFTCVAAPPPAPPAQHSSAEGLPPLPLPVVPLRRTEKKNPPRPPVLIAKISTKNQNDWATNPTDAQNLLKWMAKNLNVHFSDMTLPDGQIPTDPKTVPVLYRTGHDAFAFSPEQKEKLRNYLFKGGTLVLESCCGRRAFAEAALREIRDLIPERPPYRLPNDHPLFKSYFDIKDIKYRPYALKAGAQDGDPAVIGIDIGCRTAVFFFRWDVSCGWDDQPDTPKHRCLGYTIETAKQLGANLMAYISSERSAALPLSQALDFVDTDKATSDKFVIAQVKYSGLWKCREAGLSMLLSNFHEQTKVAVKFEREEVALTSSHLFDLPFVYFTGHQDFTLTPAERGNLAKYIRQGGVVFAESCCGRDSFRKAFQREIAAALGGAQLERLPATHPVFAYPNNIKDVQPLPALAEKLKCKTRIPPELYGINVDGHLGVVFSPHGLACGWELAQCPYCGGIHSRDALALGINILANSLLQ